VRLRNKLGEDREFHLSLTSEQALRLDAEGTGQAINVTVPADKTVLQRVYVTAAPDADAAHTDTTDLRIWVEDTASGDRASRATTFIGKETE
jgi:hypothetical protein